MSLIYDYAWRFLRFFKRVKNIIFSNVKIYIYARRFLSVKMWQILDYVPASFVKYSIFFHFLEKLMLINNINYADELFNVQLDSTRKSIYTVEIKK